MKITQEEKIEYYEFFKRNRSVVISELESRIDNSDLTENEKIEYKQKLNESLVGLVLVYNILRYVGALLTPAIFALVRGTTKRITLMNMKRRYNNLVNAYAKLKYKDEIPQQTKDALVERAKKLKSDIERFKNDVPDLVSKEPSEEDSDDYSEEPTLQDLPPEGTKSSGTPVGEVTAKIDAEALAIWQADTKRKCDKLEGGELWGCKEKSVTKALMKIRTGMNLCNGTDNPEGCKQTLRNLVAHWNDRKRKYMMKRIRGK